MINKVPFEPITSLQVGVFALLFLTLGCGREQTAKSLNSQSVDLTGEWVVEWEDKKRGYKEAIYVWIVQEGNLLKGSALDPNLIPAAVTGRAHSRGVTFDVGPESGRGFYVSGPPVSTFKGTITGANSMNGQYRAEGQRGPWRATRRAQGTSRTVSVSAETKLRLSFTSEEYDVLLSLHPPLSATDAEIKEGCRVGDHFEIEYKIGELGGWIYRYRILGDFVRVGPGRSEKERRLQQKILGALNDHGYPWKSIPP